MRGIVGDIVRLLELAHQPGSLVQRPLHGHRIARVAAQIAVALGRCREQRLGHRQVDDEVGLEAAPSCAGPEAQVFARRDHGRARPATSTVKAPRWPAAAITMPVRIGNWSTRGGRSSSRVVSRRVTSRRGASWRAASSAASPTPMTRHRPADRNVSIWGAGIAKAASASRAAILGPLCAPSADQPARSRMLTKVTGGPFANALLEQRRLLGAADQQLDPGSGCVLNLGQLPAAQLMVDDRLDRTAEPPRQGSAIQRHRALAVAYEAAPTGDLHAPSHCACRHGLGLTPGVCGANVLP